MAGAAVGGAAPSGRAFDELGNSFDEASRVGEQVLIAKIRSTPGNYQLDAEDLMKLKKAGVSDAVMTAMMEVKH